MAITQTISNLPPAPQSTDPTNFRTKADAFVAALNTFEDQLNLAIPQMNALEANINTIYASAASASASASDSALSAQGSANYQGIWTSKGYALGQTVSDANGIRWLCKLTHTTAQAPTEGTYWTIAIPYIGAIGNINAPLLDMPLKNSLAMKSGVGSATFTRASTATYIDRYGVLQVAGVDTPRFEKQGYLNEGGSTNLLLQSTNMMTSPWSNGIGGFVTQSTDNSTVPFSSDASMGLNVTKFVATSTPAVLFSRQTQTLNSSTTYTASVFMYVPATYGSTFSFQVDFSDTYNGNTNTYPTGAWVRATSTVTITTGSTSNFDFNILIDGAAPVANDTWYCVAPQLEALPFASSYIPTTSSTVTRATDNLTITSIGNSNGVTNRFSEETLLFDFATLGGSENSYKTVFEFNGQSTAYRAFYNTSASSMGLQYGTDTVHGSQLGVGVAPLNVMTRYALSHDTLGVTKSYMNGVFKQSGSSGTSNSSVPSTAIIIGSNVSNDAGSKSYGHYSNFRIYDRAFTAYEVSLA